MLPSNSGRGDNSNSQLLQNCPSSSTAPPFDRRLVYGEPSPLGIGRKIFLSHSGGDKPFVRFLQRALKDSSYDAFYDEQTLPKAVPVSMHNILEELPSCDLGVLVLSDDFFERTPNPMHELTAMVAHKVRLLPLFYRLSVPQFKEESRRARWMQKWLEWGIPQDVLTLWTKALKIMGTFNGLEMCIEATNEVTYIDKIVCAVCEALPLAIRWSDEHAQGMDRLCMIVAKKYTSIYQHYSIDETHSDPLVVGVHGFGGVGKSTLCNALCDFYFSQFHGRVCLIDLGSSVDTNPPKTTYSTASGALNRLITVLSALTNFKVPHSQLHHSQLQNVLKERIRRGRHPLFLVIDNVQPTEESKDEAEFYFNCRPFPTGSKIFITSRSADVLRVLTEPHKFSVVQEFPNLMFHEARIIFLAKALPVLCTYSTNAPMKINDHTLSPEQNAVVDKCVKLCTLHRLTDHYGLYSDYHPLLLISFASFLRVQSMSSDPLEWKSSITDVGLQGRGIIGLERVNGMLQKSFNLLDEQEQTIFIDLALYMPSTSIKNAQEWLQCVYNCQNVNIQQSLSKLRALSFITDRVHWPPGTGSHMHDLLVEFATKKAQGHCDYILKDRCGGEEAHNALAMGTESCRTRVTISRCQFEQAYSTLDLSSLHRIEVLHLLHNQGLAKVLVSSYSLRSLVNVQPANKSHFETEIIVVDQGSWWQRQGINNGMIRWLVLDNCKIKTKTSILPWPLAYISNLWTFKYLVHLSMSHVQAFDLDSLSELLHLETLELSHMPVKRLDMCSSLNNVELSHLPRLEFISGLEKSTKMECLSIERCDKLRSLQVLDKGMARFQIHAIIACHALERVDNIHPPLVAVSTEEGSLGYGGNPEESELPRSMPLNYLSSCPHYMKKLDEGRLPKECHVDLACDQRSAMEETSRNMVQESASIYSSGNCRAMMPTLVLTGGSGLAGLAQICLTDAQNIFHFVRALHVASVRDLWDLQVSCREGAAGGCGCDTDPPLFGLLNKGLTHSLTYRCSQVKDVSSLENCKQISRLVLHGCDSVENWPNFVNMTSLRSLVLSETSLEQWAHGLLETFSLENLTVHGCIRFTEEKLTELITMDKTTPVFAMAALAAFKLDLHTQKRNRYAIAECLRSRTPELISVIEQGRIFHTAREIYEFDKELGELVYELWNSEEMASNFLQIPDMSCRGAAIISCIKPLLTHPTIIWSLLRPLCHEPSSLRWLVAVARPTREDPGRMEILRLIKFRSPGHLGLVLIGLLSIGSSWYDPASVENCVVDDYFIPIVKSFVDRAEFSEKMYGVLSYDPMQTFDMVDSLVKDRYSMLDHELLAVRIADAVCKLARVPKVEAKLGNLFMLHVIHPLEARVQQDYATYRARLSRVQEMGMPRPLYNGNGYYHPMRVDN